MTEPAKGADDYTAAGGRLSDLRGVTIKENQAQLLVRLAATAELFQPEGEDTVFATITVGADQHQETWRLRSSGFRRWLAAQFYGKEHKAPGAQALQDALLTLEGFAQADGRRYPVALRVARNPEAIYIDRGTAAWDAIEITAKGWQIVAKPPVRFRRAKGMLALPAPAPGGSLLALRSFLNVADTGQMTLLLSWLVGALHPRGPYPVLVLHGEHGAAKSTAARLLRAMIDPNTSPLRAEPREERDLIIAASNAWVVSFDNLSNLPSWLSDALSRLATGSGFGTRQLYSDDDEVLFTASRPIILNGIEEIVTRPDLMDRSMLVELPTIGPAQRVKEADLWAGFTAAWPTLLGALCTAVRVALRDSEHVELPELPRMADFATWVTAAEPGLGWPTGRFLQAYTENQGAGHALALDASLIAAPLQELLEPGQWTGRLRDLLEALGSRVGEERRRHKDWPKSPRGLLGMLTRLAPTLRAVGITYTTGREAGTNLATVSLKKRVV